MRRRPIILLLLALALVVAACGDDDGGGTATTAPGDTTTAPGDTTTAPELGDDTAQTAWYTDWNTGALARWDIPSGTCSGVTQAGLSADLIAAGLGWVWVTDCRGGQLVRFDVQTGEVTGRLDLGGCPSAIAIAFDLVWLALPSEGKIVAVDPESGAIVAEGTSGMDTPVFLAAGSLDVAGSEYYWKLDELPVSVGSGTVWAFNLDDAASTYTLLPGSIHGLGVSLTGGTDAAVLVGQPPNGAPLDYTDPNYQTSLYLVGSQGATQVGDPFEGFYNYLAAFDGHYVISSKVTGKVIVRNGAAVPVPVGGPPGPPVAGPPPPDGGEDGGDGTGVWVGNRDPGAPGLFFFWPQDPPAALEAPTVPLACQMGGSPLAVWDYVVLGVGRIDHEAAQANAMDRTAFPMDPFPEESVTPTTTPGPRFSSCSVSYESSARTITGMEGTTDPGATVVLSIEVGTLLYADLATALAGDDGNVALPDFNLDTLTTPIPAGATITVVLTADGNYPGACRLEVET